MAKTTILIDGYKFEYIKDNDCHYLFGLDDENKTIIVTKRDTVTDAFDKVINQARIAMYNIMSKNSLQRV